MEQMIPVAATALLGGLIAVFLKREAGEISLLLSIATTVLLLVLVGSAAVEILSLLRSLAQQASISDALLTPMLKVLGIEVVTNLAAHICKDGGGHLRPVRLHSRHPGGADLDRGVAVT